MAKDLKDDDNASGVLANAMYQVEFSDEEIIEILENANDRLSENFDGIE